MLLDSNIVIYAAEPGYDAVRDFIGKHRPSVSIISKVEVLGYHQLDDENRQRLGKIFDTLPILALSDYIIDEAIALRQRKKMSLGDALIAGTALIPNLPLATANVKDFTWIDGITVVNPLQKKQNALTRHQ